MKYLSPFIFATVLLSSPLALAKITTYSNQEALGHLLAVEDFKTQIRFLGELAEVVVNSDEGTGGNVLRNYRFDLTYLEQTQIGRQTCFLSVDLPLEIHHSPAGIVESEFGSVNVTKRVCSK